jgi:hypothetical protein
LRLSGSGIIDNNQACVLLQFGRLTSVIYHSDELTNVEFEADLIHFQSKAVAYVIRRKRKHQFKFATERVPRVSICIPRYPDMPNCVTPLSTINHIKLQLANILIV